MKKISLLIVLLASFTMQAKFFNGTLTYADGTSKNGLIERPAIKTGKIKYKIADEERPQLIDSDLLESVTITTDKGTETFVHLYPAMEKKDGLQRESDKQWFTVMSIGNVNFLYYDTKLIVNDSAPGIQYHIHVPGTDYAVYFTTKVAGVAKTVGAKAMYRDMVLHIFDDICPELVEKFKSGDYKTDDMEELIKFYTKTCG